MKKSKTYRVRLRMCGNIVKDVMAENDQQLSAILHTVSHDLRKLSKPSHIVCTMARMKELARTLDNHFVVYRSDEIASCGYRYSINVTINPLTLTERAINFPISYYESEIDQSYETFCSAVRINATSLVIDDQHNISNDGKWKIYTIMYLDHKNIDVIENHAWKIV